MIWLYVKIKPYLSSQLEHRTRLLLNQVSATISPMITDSKEASYKAPTD
jgi:hypothetical protein